MYLSYVVIVMLFVILCVEDNKGNKTFCDQLQPDKPQQQTLRKQDHKPACGKPEPDNTKQAAQHWKSGAGHTEKQLNTANMK